MSDLIDRYLAAIAANLPKADRDDIAAELRDILYSKREAREEELGRPLTRAEEEALIKAFGHPLEVAARYGKNQYLIGPTAYPFYVFTLKIVLGIVVFVFLAKLVLGVLIDGVPGPHAEGIVSALVAVFGIVTLVFTIIDRSGGAAKMAEKWRPAQLPMMSAPKARSMWDVLFEMVVVAMVIAWWVGLFHIPDPTPRNVDIRLGPVFDTLYWPILLLLIAQLAMDGFELVTPGLVRLHSWLRISYHLALAGLLWVMWQAGHWIEVVATAGRPDLQERLQRGFDNGFRIGLAFTVVCIAYEIGRAGLRLVRYNRMMRVGVA